MNIIFKKATIDDVEEIINLCNECFEENTSLEFAKKVFTQTQNDSNHIYIVGILEGKIVSHLKITIIPTMYEKMNTYAILNHICVKPEYRRQNIATMMLDETTKICEEYGCKTMELWSKNFRIPAHECYKSYGFIANDAKYFTKEV